MTAPDEKLNLLFVDDDRNVLDALQRSLRPMRHRWSIAFADSGEQALAWIASHPVDVIVSDMKMPGMDGNELLAIVAREHPDVIRIVLSGHSEESTSRRAVKVAHQFLAKPCTTESLVRVVDRARELHLLLRSQAVRTLAGRVGEIPSRPGMYVELLDLLDSPETSGRDVGRLVSRDMAMTAKVLQIVNSAFFGLSRTVTSAEQAVAYLGMDTVKALVLSVGAFSIAGNPRIPGFSSEALWLEAERVGPIARSVATLLGVGAADTEASLTAGLLHDVGRLVLASALGEAGYGPVVRSVNHDGMSTQAAERKILGATHAEVGGYLLGIWGLPDPIVEAVAYHHAPSECAHQQPSPLTAVHIAMAFAARHWDKRVDHAYVQAMGVAPEQLRDWARELALDPIDGDELVA